MEDNMSTASRFDIASALEWYESTSSILLYRLSRGHARGKLPYQVSGRRRLHLTIAQLNDLFHLFPEQARQRSVLRRIEGRQSTWFHRDSLNGRPLPTTKLSEALSQTAIASGFTDYAEWNKTSDPQCDIHLYHIRRSVCSSTVQYIRQAEVFVHEFAHSIIAPVIYGGKKAKYKLRLPNGRIVNGFNYLTRKFAPVAESQLPISHYSSAYRDANGKFKSDVIFTAINEEMAECITAYLLGFIFCDDKDRDLIPFVNRGELLQIVHNFLYAERVNQ
jgi:hypothetical protein